jgi:excisionase family DNA binding protein
MSPRVAVTAAAPVALLTIPETAERLRISKRAVYLLIDTGDLRTVNIASAKGASRMRVREDDLAAFIDKRTAAAPTKVNVA